MNELLPFEQVHDGLNREAWLAQRAFGVGASESPILLGLVNYSDPLTLYAEKRGEVAHEEPEDRQLLDWGTDCQDSVIRYLHRQTELKIERTVAMYRSTQYPWMTCTPDGIVDGTGEPVEVKVQTYGYDEDEWQDGIPEKFRVQCQHQMIVLGKRRNLFGCTIWGKPPIWCWYEWDQVLANRIIQVTKRFWQCVQDGTPPESNGSDGARNTALALSKKLPETVELYASDIEEIRTKWQNAAEKQDEYRLLAKQQERERKAAEDALILKMGAADRAVTVDGWVFEKTRQERHNKAKPASVMIVEGFKVHPPEEEF